MGYKHYHLNANLLKVLNMRIQIEYEVLMQKTNKINFSKIDFEYTNPENQISHEQ